MWTGNRGRLSSWGRALVLLVVPLFLIGPSLLPGQRFLPQAPVQYEPLRSEYPDAAEAADTGSNRFTGDRVFPALSDQIELRRRLGSGTSWTWEEKWGFGAPLLGNTIHGPYYPPNALGLVLAPDRAAGWLAILSLFLAGLGTWLFLWRRGLTEVACLVGALAYQGTGWGVVNLHYAMKVDAALWLPWCLWALHGFRSGDRRGLPLLALCAAAAALAGFPPIAGFTLAAVAVAATLWALGDALGGSSARTAVVRATAPIAALWLGVLLASIQLVPTAAAALESPRGTPTPERVAFQALPFATLATAAVPDPFAAPTVDPPAHLPLAAWIAQSDRGDAALLANGLEWNTHPGSAAYVLALIGLLVAGRRALLPFALGALAFAWAQDWPGMRVLYHFPGLNGGAPTRALSVAWFAWVWLAALGVDRLVGEDSRRVRTVAAVLASALALGAVAVRTFGLPSAERFESALAERFAIDAQAVRSLLPSEATTAAFEHFAGGLALAGVSFALVAAGALALRCVRGAGPLALAVPILLALATEVSVTSRPHLLPRDLGGIEVFPRSNALDAVARAAGEGRVLRWAPGGVGDVIQLARPNMLQVYGVRDISAYLAFQQSATTQWFEAIDPRMREGDGVARLPALHLLDDPRLDRAGITCILAREPLLHERLTLEYDADGFYVHRRRNDLPPSEWIGEPPGAESARDRAERARTFGALLSLLGVLIWVVWVHRLARRGRTDTEALDATVAS
ncbi:Bacterial membrane protein YfhO [Planctomycetes bacterium Pla163]|uniref:Bacterial membrane protein YfhO n=1 Tax=Rohdeia mirabilis TaxID=2528008 RepID=A0A518D1F6_9BACT|nr:Bacterial membrane protein YfhO [Planctomycetes bacterium Pla163]